MSRIAAASLLATASLVHAQQVIYVDDDAPKGGDGQSWDSAFQDLQDALDVAKDSDHLVEIRVAQGIYLPDRGTGDRQASFELDSDADGVGSALTLSLRLVGGFAGLASGNPDDFDPTAFVSILSGDLYGDDQPGFVNIEDNSRHVVTVPFLAGGVELVGLTIRAGHADGAGLDGRGAGMLASPGSPGPQILHLDRCTIEDNLAAHGGGGIYADVWDLYLSECRIRRNRSIEGAGGGINAIYANLRLSHVLENEAPTGGGVYSVFQFTMRDSLAAGNVAQLGGAIAIEDAFSTLNTITRSTIANNVADIGAGVWAAGGAFLDIQGSVLWDNEALIAGGALGVWDVNTLVSVNESDLEGGQGAVHDPANVVDWGAGNIAADPLFADPDGPDGNPWTVGDNDYSLMAESPCVDATADVIDGVDLAGINRPRNGDCDCLIVNDMGAYEVSTTPECNDGIIHVLQSAPPGGDGQSWDTAFNSLAEAMNGASCDSVFWIGAGVYTPDLAGQDKTQSFQVMGKMELYGGFAGGETSLEQRDPTSNMTVLSGDLNGDDGPGFQNRDDNAETVVRVTAAEDVVIDGIVVTGGESQSNGAGVLVDDSSELTLIVGCTLLENRAPWARGGAIYTDAESTTISDCTIVHNMARWGGGIYADHGAQIVGCTIEGNEADDGGGIYAAGMAIVVSNCAILGNVAEDAGGGIREDSWQFAMDNTEVAANEASHGAGIFLDGEGGLIESCVFSSNEAVQAGGAVYVDRGGYIFRNVQLRSCLAPLGDAVFVDRDPFLLEGAIIEGNLGAFAVYAEDNATLRNVTITSNAGIALHGDGAWISAENCILWNNASPNLSGVKQIEYSCVESGYDGPGNIDTDPSLSASFDLLPGSACIDAGANAFLSPEYAIDLAGNPRRADDPWVDDTGGGIAPIVDMGAWEFQGSSCPADFNGDKKLDVLDFVVFQIAFQFDDPAADCNADGDLTILDFICFQQHFVAGCP